MPTAIPKRPRIDANGAHSDAQSVRYFTSAGKYYPEDSNSFLAHVSGYKLAEQWTRYRAAVRREVPPAAFKIMDEVFSEQEPKRFLHWPNDRYAELVAALG